MSGQMIHRTGGIVDAALGTLANVTSQEIDARYGGELQDRAVLLAWEGSGEVHGIDLGDMSGCLIALVDEDITDAEINTIMTTRLDRDDPENVAIGQKIKAIADVILNGIESSKGFYRWWIDASFGKGVPFEEGNGWKLIFYNRSGSALTTGGFVSVARIKRRFAYVR